MLELNAERESSRRSTRAGRAQVAYLSLEYALDASLPLGVSGLGVLAGDLLKTAHDLHLPSVGVGILWDEGAAGSAGPRRGAEPKKAVSRRGLERVEVAIEVEIAGAIVPLDAWCTKPGAHAPLYLLEPTLPEHRALTRSLVGASEIERLAQEIILGVGGVRLLAALGIEVDVYHLADASAVLAGLELLREQHGAGLGFGAALAAVRGRVVCTTHAPIGAASETHPEWVMRDVGATLGLPETWLEALGGDPFSMAVAALRLAFRANAVSERQGDAARRQWEHVTDRAPIVAITSGVHVPSWQDARVRVARGRQELVETRRQLKRELAAAVAQRAHVSLDPACLLIAASGAATAEDRLDLLLGDPARLEPLVEGGALQRVFALRGRAGAASDESRARRDKLTAAMRRWPGRVVVLPELDLAVAGLLARGCDVWLETPRPPVLGAGTSGMKAALSGALCVGVPGGGWSEGFRHGVTGWLVGGSEVGADAAAQDAADRAALFHLLEREILPAWRDTGRWAEMVEASLDAARRRFSSERMLESYYRLLYDPCLRSSGSDHAMVD